MLQIYTGEGKGKTTASIGQMVRFVGYDKKAIFSQFLKTTESGEVLFFEKFCANITVIRNNKPFPFSNKMTEEQLREITDIHNSLFRETIEKFKDSEVELLVLDEIISAYNLGLIDKDMVRDFITKKIGEKVVIITGRDCPKEFIEIADYISDIKSVKNPFDNGILAKKGIEY